MHIEENTKKPSLLRSVRSVASREKSPVINKVVSPQMNQVIQSKAAPIPGKEQSPNNIFSKIKSFMFPTEGTPNRSPKAVKGYKCECGPSKQPYACYRASRWLRNCRKKTFQDGDFDHQKSLLLYRQLSADALVSGSENQIGKDITRTLTPLLDREG